MCALPLGEKVLWGVQLSAASFFLLVPPPYGGHVLPQSRALPLGGAQLRRQLRAPPQSPGLLYNFVAPVVVPGA